MDDGVDIGKWAPIKARIIKEGDRVMVGLVEVFVQT
jgi:hypothetical protein